MFWEINIGNNDLPSSLPNPCPTCHQFLSHTQNPEFLVPRIVAASFVCEVMRGYILALCGVCASAEVVFGVPRIAGNVVWAVHIGPCIISSTLLN